MALQSVLRPEGSIVAGVAVVGLVYAVYQLNVGEVSSAAATDAHHPLLDSSKRKAGWTSVALVAGVALLARDPNIVILGGASIIAMEASYRHAIMQDPNTGAIVPPPAKEYQPAQNVVPLPLQGATG
jgi:hypothetical protein